MRRVLPVFLPLLLTAACGDMAGPPATTVEQVHAGFPPRGVVDTVVVDAVERLPLRAAELVAPDGTTTPANYLNVDPLPSESTGQWQAKDPFQHTALAGGAPGVPFANGTAADAALQGQQQLFAMVSTADILLPDPVAYRRDWARYRIRLTFGTTPGDAETQEIAAPEPLPVPAAPPTGS
jgi:hypothetical protein